jgi:hypothetical protein
VGTCRGTDTLGSGHTIWEFLGSEVAGPRAAVLFTILAGAKRHRLEPWAYLRDVLLPAYETRRRHAMPPLA